MFCIPLKKPIKGLFYNIFVTTCPETSFRLWIFKSNQKDKVIIARIRRIGKVLFHRCLSAHKGGGEGYPSRRFFPWSRAPGPFWGYPSLSQEEVPQSQLEGREDRGTPPPPSWDWSNSPAGTGVPPPNLELGYHHSGDTGWVFAMQQAVCLLQPRRRTFLLNFIFEKKLRITVFLLRPLVPCFCCHLPWVLKPA